MRKILLIAYYFDPFKGVGGKRMSYWADAFFNDPSYACTVVTATVQNEGKSGIYYVQDNRNSWLDRWLSGYSWMAAIKHFFNTKDFKFDYVIISGGPFGHFAISRYLKNKYSCKVILDFRDPFSRNSRFNTFFLKDYLKKKIEGRFLKYSDHAITVNKYCRKLLLDHLPEGKVSIIENGFDERVLDVINVTKKYDDGAIHIAYAGSFYSDRDPRLFLKVLTQQEHIKTKFVFHHIGEQSDFLKEFRFSDRIIEHGHKSYSDTIAIMKKCTAGLLITGGEPMESTTKIYDYISCGLHILIITSGRHRTGSIHEITSKDYDTTSWVDNDKDQIQSFFENFTPLPVFQHRDKIRFSRRNGFDTLKKLLESL